MAKVGVKVTKAIMAQVKNNEDFENIKLINSDNIIGKRNVLRVYIELKHRNNKTTKYVILLNDNNSIN